MFTSELRAADGLDRLKDSNRLKTVNHDQQLVTRK